MIGPRVYLLLGAVVAVLCLVVPTSAPQPGDHERMGCGSVVAPVHRDVSNLEPFYRKPTLELCARARSTRVTRAVTAAASATLAAVFMYLRRRNGLALATAAPPASREARPRPPRTSDIRPLL